MHLKRLPRCHQGRRALAFGIAGLLMLQAPMALAFSCVHSGQHGSAIVAETSANTSVAETEVSDCHDAMRMPTMVTATTEVSEFPGHGQQTGLMPAIHPTMSGSSHDDAMSEDCCSGECSCAHSVSFAIPLPDMASEVAVLTPHFAALITAPSTRQESILHPPI